MLKAFALDTPTHYIVEEYVWESTPFTKPEPRLEYAWDFDTEPKAISKLVDEACKHPDRAYSISKCLEESP